jgi:hypothetical protein
MIEMTREETDRILGGWSCQTYTTFWYKSNECREYYKHGNGQCLNGNNYCGKYT